MYNDLIKRLRLISKSHGEFIDLYGEAADAIEELVRKEKFHAFLWNTIQPNEMEQYLTMYRSQAVPSEPSKEVE